MRIEKTARDSRRRRTARPRASRAQQRGARPSGTDRGDIAPPPRRRGRRMFRRPPLFFGNVSVVLCSPTDASTPTSGTASSRSCDPAVAPVDTTVELADAGSSPRVLQPTVTQPTAAESTRCRAVSSPTDRHRRRSFQPNGRAGARSNGVVEHAGLLGQRWAGKFFVGRP